MFVVLYTWSTQRIIAWGAGAPTRADILCGRRRAWLPRGMSPRRAKKIARTLLARGYGSPPPGKLRLPERGEDWLGRDWDW